MGGGGGGSNQASPEQIQSQIDQLPLVNPEVHVPDVSAFFAPLSLNTPAFSFSGGGGNFTFGRTGDNPLDQFDARIPGFFNTIDDLRSRFRPGFSELREARLGATTAARQRGLSNLRSALANRRIQGSSFARAEQVQAQREFGQLEAEQQAQSFLEEVAANDQLLRTEAAGLQAITERARVDIQEFQAALQAVDQSRLAGTAAAQLGVEGQRIAQNAAIANLNAVSGIISSLNAVNAQTAGQSSSFGSIIGGIAGTIVGSAAGPIGASIGSQVGANLFGGSGGGNPSLTSPSLAQNNGLPYPGQSRINHSIPTSTPDQGFGHPDF